MKACLAALMILLAAAPAQAAWRVALQALSADGTRAIITYDADWVEVDLATGATWFLPPAQTCIWNSAAYAPTGREFALTATCSADLVCAGKRTGVWRSRADGIVALVALAEGRRWGAAYWRAGPSGLGDILVTETPIFEPVASNVDQLGRSEGCARGAGRFVSVDAATGRAARLDFSPRGWASARVIAASRRRMLAALRPRDVGGDAYTAETTLAEACRDGAADAALCEGDGREAALEWSGGDWRFLPGEDLAAPAESEIGRRLATPDFAVRVRETCPGERCRVKITRAGPTSAGESLAIDAPAGRFGDLALSADGRVLASLAAERGTPVRRFDLFDAATGARRALAHILALSPPWGDAR